MTEAGLTLLRKSSTLRLQIDVRPVESGRPLNTTALEPAWGRSLRLANRRGRHVIRTSICNGPAPAVAVAFAVENTMITRIAAAIMATSLILAGCGGGGSPPSAPSIQPPPMAPPIDPPPQDPAPGDAPAQEPGTDPNPPPAEDPDPEEEEQGPVIPPVPTGVTAAGGIGIVMVSWDSPFMRYDGHALAHIYRNTSSNFSTATLIGTSRSFLYTDRDVEDDTVYHYWVVWESKDGERGPVSSVASDRTGIDPTRIFDDPEPEPDPEDPEPLSGPATLSNVGTSRQSGMATYSVVNLGGRFPGTFSGSRPVYTFDNWGIWAKVGNDTLFRVEIRDRTDGLSGFSRHIDAGHGQSGSKPTSGAAVWTGGVRAWDAHPDTFGTPVTGTARLEVDLSASTMDVDFTGFSGGHPDLSWDNLQISSNGRFGRQQVGNEIIGAFYGAEHQGVAGNFKSSRLDGVFGATR